MKLWEEIDGLCSKYSKKHETTVFIGPKSTERTVQVVVADRKERDAMKWPAFYVSSAEEFRAKLHEIV